MAVKIKETGKLLIGEIILIAVCAIIGVAALAVTYLVPDRYIYDNVKESSIILHNEGLGIYLWETIRATELDTYTDGLMLNITYTTTDDGIRDVLSGTKVEVGDINPMESLYEVIALANDNYWIENYARYWHGHQVLLRPLLCFFTYADIRQINMILQLALVFIFVSILARTEHRILVIPFWMMYIFLMPVSLFSSLQYSPCFYIMMLTLMALFTFKGRIYEWLGKGYLFVLSGIMTAYFDLLTYPLVTLAVPLIAHLGSDYDCMVSVKKSIKDTLTYTASWGIGYVGMWAAKWAITSMLTDENVLYNALEQIKHRSGHFEPNYTWFSTVKLNLKACNTTVILITFIGLLLYIAGSVMMNYRKKSIKLFPCTWVILFVAAYPFIWYYVTLNHSSAHYYFTWRELAISVFGIAMSGAVNMKGSALHVTS